MYDLACAGPPAGLRLAAYRQELLPPPPRSRTCGWRTASAPPATATAASAIGAATLLFLVGGQRAVSAAHLRCSSRWARRWKSRATHHRNGSMLVALRASEGVEVADALGKDIEGKVIIVGWDPGRQELKPGEIPWSPEESMEELEVLCKTLDLEVADRILQKFSPGRKGRLPLGKGKIQELRKQVDAEPDIAAVIFDQDLPFRSLLSLKGQIAPESDVTILDRTSLILRIFAERARTREAKLQVTLANQQYMLPRLRYYLTTGGGLEARGGSAGAGGGSSSALKGKGETQLARDRTMLKQQMAAVRKKIEEIRTHREDLRGRSTAGGLPVVSLVGYTNAGKSTLLNKLCGTEQVTAEDRLFETLDPTRRRVKLEGGREVLMVDTVGFIQRLPEQLVAGFTATLEELTEATVVLHVVDMSSSTASQQISTVMQTLGRLRGYDIKTPQVLVLNKCDKVEGGEMSEALQQCTEFEWPGLVTTCKISALNNIGLNDLSQAIEKALVECTSFGAEKLKLLIPYTKSSDYAKLRGPPPMAKVDHEEHTAEGYLVDITASTDVARQLRKFEVKA